MRWIPFRCRFAISYGMEASTERVHLVDTATSDFVTLDRIPKMLLGTVCPVILRSPEHTVKGLGTAFCLGTYTSGDALYATARHILSDFDPPQPGYELFVLVPETVGAAAPSHSLHYSGVPVRTLGFQS